MKRSAAFVITFLALAAIALVAASLGTETWGIIEITRGNDNGTDGCEVTRTVGLFTGKDESRMLSDSLIAVDEAFLYAQIAMCCLTILFGLVAAAVASYNLCSRPFESWAGPSGLTAYFSCGATFNLVSVFLFVGMGFTDLNDTILESCPIGQTVPCYGDGDREFTQESFTFGYSFYLLVAALAPFIFGTVAVVATDKNLTKKTKNKLCPGSLEEPEIQEGNDNNIMMF